MSGVNEVLGTLMHVHEAQIVYFWKVECVKVLHHLLGVNTLICICHVCGVHSWQNGTRCRDGVELLWYHSHLVWLFFEVPSLHALLFIHKTF